MLENGKRALVQLEENLSVLKRYGFQYTTFLSSAPLLGSLKISFGFRVYIRCGHLDFTDLMAALQPLMDDSKVADCPNQPTVTILEMDYGTIYFRSKLRNDIHTSIDIDYIECGEGCDHHPYEIPDAEPVLD